VALFSICTTVDQGDGSEKYPSGVQGQSPNWGLLKPFCKLVMSSLMFLKTKIPKIQTFNQSSVCSNTNTVKWCYLLCIAYCIRI